VRSCRARRPPRSRPEHVTEPVAYDAILLAGFGGPEGQDDVIPFLATSRADRGIPDERLEEVAHHYRHFGGVSPINEQNRVLKAALEAELASRGIDLPVLWGNRNWDPYLNDALVEARAAGHTKLIAIATSAYSSYSSCRQYREDFADALADAELGDVIQIDKVRQFFDHPGFVQPFVEGVRDGIAGLEASVPGLDRTTEVEVLFATHSIPSTDAAKSGPAERGFGEGGAYAAQHLAVAEVVMREAGAADVPWQLVYQSRSGPPSMPWLEPDINDAIEELPGRGPQGRRDRAARVRERPHGGALGPRQRGARDRGRARPRRRCACRRPAPTRVRRRLVDLVLERVNGTPSAERPPVTELGPWYDVCRPGCCENVRLGFRPALAGSRRERGVGTVSRRRRHPCRHPASALAMAQTTQIADRHRQGREGRDRARARDDRGRHLPRLARLARRHRRVRGRTARGAAARRGRRGGALPEGPAHGRARGPPPRGDPKRADARDALCARDGLTLADLPEGARVGTGSPRRIAQLLAARPDVVAVDIRGNVDTRLGKVASGELDAVLLAAAGLGRLGRSDAATEPARARRRGPPAAGQGALRDRGPT
jgi:ferrochelatase